MCSNNIVNNRHHFVRYFFQKTLFWFKEYTTDVVVDSISIVTIEHRTFMLKKTFLWYKDYL